MSRKPATPGERLLIDVAEHLNSLESSQSIGLILTPTVANEIGNELAALTSSKTRLISLQEAEDVRCDTSVDYFCLISWGDHDRRRAYLRLTKLKELGCVVLFELPNRRLFNTEPNWQRTGINSEGMFRIAVEYVKTLRPRSAGTYCEFGVFDGRSFTLAYHALKGECQRFFAFDSFSGIAGTLESEASHFQDGGYFANLETFKHNLTWAGVDLLRTEIVKGVFSETIKGRSPEEYGLKDVFVVHVDTDVYEPALQALELVGPVLVDGALLLFDDFDQFGGSNKKGERRALSEFLHKNKDFEVEPFRTYNICGRSFIFHRS